MNKIYAASKTRHAPMWRALRDQGVNIISTWIDEAGPGETKDKRDLARRCFAEIQEANWLIAYADDGDVMKGALVEIGAALASFIPVLAIGPVISETSAFRSHPLWINQQSIEQAILTTGFRPTEPQSPMGF